MGEEDEENDAREQQQLGAAAVPALAVATASGRMKNILRDWKARVKVISSLRERERKAGIKNRLKGKD